MNIKQVILPTLCCLPLLSACASYQPANTVAWVVKPMSSIKTSNDNPEALYQLGRYYQGQNRYEQAVLAYQKALAADNSFAEARNGLGVIYSIQGNYAEAIAVLKLATQQAPKAAHIYNNLGYAYYLQGQNNDAIAALSVAATLDPGNQRALNNLGLAYAKAGNNTDAIIAFTQALTTPHITERGIATENKMENKDASQAVTPTQTAQLDAPVERLAPQSLALPKDRGVISRVATTTVPLIESQVKAVQVAPNVYELRQQPVLSVQVAATPNTVQTKLEIANGNGITGMAKRVNAFLHGQGYLTQRITNQKPYKVQITQIQYRSGHQMEAQRLQARLPKQSDLVQNNEMHENINVRIVLGKNIAEHVAFFDGAQGKTLLALNEK
ncbi:MAG: tetratricopeptide repeat protein [Sulfuriferula sp.]